MWSAIATGIGFISMFRNIKQNTNPVTSMASGEQKDFCNKKRGRLTVFY
jgi:hypothetical protein